MKKRFFVLSKTFLPNLKILEVDENGIIFKNIFFKINSLSWSDVKDIYLYQFNGTEKIRIPYKQNKSSVQKRRKFGRFNIGGVIVFVPRKIPTKWIFIDDGRGDNGENIFENRDSQMEMVA